MPYLECIIIISFIELEKRFLRLLFWRSFMHGYDSFAIRLIAHFWRQAWRLLDLHGNPFMWLLSILLPDLRSHSLLPQLLWLAHVRVNEDHVLHVVDALAPFFKFLLSHWHASTLRCRLTALSGSRRPCTCLHWRIKTLSHWHDSHRALNWIVHGVKRRFLCHVRVARAAMATAHASSLRLQMTCLRLSHLHGFENRVLFSSKDQNK